MYGQVGFPRYTCGFLCMLQVVSFDNMEDEVDGPVIHVVLCVCCRL